jgi:N-methylhydantoinase A/oxoprolinase/acetone carboxylase beta subunit
MLGKLGPAHQAEFVGTVSSVGGRGVCFPATSHIVSPRGIAPAVEVKDYVHQFESPGVLDLRRARDAFVALMEQAAEDVQADGLEQDDSFLDRYAELRVRGEGDVSLAAVEEMSDADWPSRAWRGAHSFGRDVGSSDIEVVSLRLRCAVQTQETFRPALPPSDGRVERARIAPPPDATALSSPNRYDRTKLLAGDDGTGPATICDGSNCIHVPPRWDWQVNRMGHVICLRRSP